MRKNKNNTSVAAQRARVSTLLLLCSLGLAACNSGSSSKTSDTNPETEDLSHLSAPANGLRDWLTFDELSATKASKPGPYHNSYFMPIGDSQPALHQFQGKLKVLGAQLTGFPANFYPSMKQFPSFSANFISYQGYLIPEQRDIIVPEVNDSYWRIILSPGKVWSEPGDNGMSRASFPFAMVEKAWNTTFNGLATFVFNEDQVSGMRVQLVQHTAPGFREEAAGLVNLSYQSEVLSQGPTLISQFEQELALQLPVENWQSLVDLHPGINWGAFDSGLLPSDISAAAIWYNNTLYLQNCRTAYGDYPYCRFMRHGVYSATKSAGGAVALTHLVQRYGSEVLDYLVKDYLEITAPHNGWDKVTFSDTLNMATGIGNNDPNPEADNIFADEVSSELVGDWNRADSAKQKLDIALNLYGNFPWGPGEILRYNTNQTFILSAAMDNLVRQREGIGLWQLLKENVYQTIGILHSPMMHTNEPDGSRGVPVMGIGLYPTVEDMIKIARLFHQLGEYQGQQLLDRETVKLALYRTPTRGLVSSVDTNEYGEGRYQLSFWGLPYVGETGCQLTIPYMAGAGGNFVVILPNGVIALRFADANNMDKRSMVDVASQLAPLCS